MRPFPLQGDDALPNSAIQRIISGALGKITVLDAAPTSTNNTVPVGEAAFNGTKLYFNIEGTLYEVTLTETA